MHAVTMANTEEGELFLMIRWIIWHKYNYFEVHALVIVNTPLLVLYGV